MDGCRPNTEDIQQTAMFGWTTSQLNSQLVQQKSTIKLKAETAKCVDEKRVTSHVSQLITGLAEHTPRISKYTIEHGPSNSHNACTANNADGRLPPSHGTHKIRCLINHRTRYHHKNGQRINASARNIAVFEWHVIHSPSAKQLNPLYYVLHIISTNQ